MKILAEPCSLSNLYGRILLCLLIASGGLLIIRLMFLDWQLDYFNLCLIVTWYAPLLSLLSFFKGHQSYWIKGCLYSSMAPS